MQTLLIFHWQRPSFLYRLCLGYCTFEPHLLPCTSGDDGRKILVPLVLFVGEILRFLEEVAVPVVVGTLVTRVERVVLALGELEGIVLVSPGVRCLVTVELVVELQLS